MDRVKKFIEFAFLTDIKNDGFCYISDEELFVLDSLTDLVNSVNLDLKSFKGKDRKIELDKLYSIFSNDEEIDIPDHLIETFKIIIDYQYFLDENGFDNRYTKKVRQIITATFLDMVDGLQVEREQFFYLESRSELIFIDDVSDFIKSIDSESFKNYNFYFRGHSCIDWDLKPSIYRFDWIKNEHNMFRDIILRNSLEFSDARSTIDKLTIMQHYGLPTRLLDITSNPLVALYFACNDNNQRKKAGELIIFNPETETIKYPDSDTVSIIANLAKSERSLSTEVNKKEFNSTYVIGKKLLHLIKEEKPYFKDEIRPKDLKKCLIVKPVNNNERVKRQQAHFFLFGCKNNISQSSDINSLFTLPDEIRPRFIIQENFKAKILDQLELLGISSDSLFPEIENGTQHLKKKYG